MNVTWHDMTREEILSRKSSYYTTATSRTRNAATRERLKTPLITRVAKTSSSLSSCGCGRQHPHVSWHHLCIDVTSTGRKTNVVAQTVRFFDSALLETRTAAGIRETCFFFFSEVSYTTVSQTLLCPERKLARGSSFGVPASFDPAAVTFLVNPRKHQRRIAKTFT